MSYPEGCGATRSVLHSVPKIGCASPQCATKRDVWMCGCVDVWMCGYVYALVCQFYRLVKTGKKDTVKS